MAANPTRPATEVGFLLVRPLRPLTEADVRRMAEWEQSAEIAALTGRDFGSTEAAIAWWQGLQRDRHRRGFAIDNRQGVFIGDLEFEHIRWKTRDAELRIAIGERRNWNRGYGTQATRMALTWAFEELHLETVYLRVLNTNLRAMHMYQKIGFRKIAQLSATGRLRGAEPLTLMELAAPRFYGIPANAAVAALGSTIWTYEVAACASDIIDSPVSKRI